MPKSRIAIVGLGRIGGSIGLALKNAKLDVEIVGHDKNPGTAGRALKIGAVDKTDWNLIGACEGAGLIVLALPLDGIKETLAALKPHLQPGVIVTDTAATKAPVLEWANDLPRGVHFVGGHPILKTDRAAGRGIDLADAALFQDATYCLTPAVSAEASAVDTVASFATALGAKPYFVEAAEHDGLAAGVQHLPALLATALAAATMSSRGWRELSRLASVDYRVMTDLVPQNGATASEQFLAHRTDLVRWIDEVIDQLKNLRDVCERDDRAALQALAESIAAKREEWLTGKVEGAAPALSYESLRTGAMHLFIGGLANRTPKPK